MSHPLRGAAAIVGTGTAGFGEAPGCTHLELLAEASRMALQAGLCTVALICYGSNQRSASGRLTSMSDPPPYEVVYKPRMPVAAYALAAARHIHQYGTTVEQLAEVAVAARGWAALNPDAFMRAPLTI